MKKYVTYVPALLLAASLLTGCASIVEAPKDLTDLENTSSSTSSSAAADYDAPVLQGVFIRLEAARAAAEAVERGELTFEEFIEQFPEYESLLSPYTNSSSTSTSSSKPSSSTTTSSSKPASSSTTISSSKQSSTSSSKQSSTSSSKSSSSTSSSKSSSGSSVSSAPTEKSANLTVVNTGYSNNAVVNGINNETILNYTTAKSDYITSFVNSTKWTATAYNFNTVMSTGFGKDGTELPIEAEYGLTAYMDGQTIKLKTYNNSGKTVSASYGYIENLDKNNGGRININVNGSYSNIATDKYINGLYRIQTTFSTGKTATLYFFVNGNQTYLCNAAVISDATRNNWINRRTDLNKVLSVNGVTPANSLTLEKFCYPTKVFDPVKYGVYTDDTPLWVEFSKSLVEDNWSDEHKVYTFYTWISENLAYDYYVAKNLTYSRASTYNDHSGTYNVWNTHAGVCFDFTNILAIMCRANGISATSIDSISMNHTWNAIYINGRWVEIDCTQNSMYGVYGEDLNTRSHTGKLEYSKFLNIIPTIALPADVTAGKELQIDTNRVC